MAAYAAVVQIKRFIFTYLHYFDAALPPGLRNIYEGACKEIQWFQDFLERLDSTSRKRMSASLGRIVEAAHQFEDIEEDDAAVEFFHSLVGTMKKIQEEWYSLLQDEEKVVSLSSSSSSSSSKMIGLRDKRCKLKELLVNERWEGGGVYLLAGMAGIGKTTLAREVYEDLDISEWFECRAWVTLGNEWKSKEITEAILAQVDPDVHKMVMGEDEEEIAQRLKESLKMGKRCLIVVDDVWEYCTFQDYMKSVLLHNIEGSRVLLTTRIKCSAYVDPRYVIEMRLLNKKESWHLLCEKVFVGGACPPQLEDIGKKIAEKCDGLPLTIVTIANLLPKVEKSLWIDVAEKRKHHIFIDAYDQISKVVRPVSSFPVLPSSLKKLSLSGLGYPWEEMRGIASLEGLQVLKLQFNAFHGQIWEVKELDFPDLRFLLIEDLDLVKLMMEPGSCFSRLQHLSIKHCYKLEKIQMKICEGVSRIEVVDSNPLVEKSIKENFLENEQAPEHLLVHYSWKSE